MRPACPLSSALTGVTRRSFLTSVVGAGVAASAFPHLLVAQAKRSGRPPRVLLRGSWQSVNIGDIGHTPGALNLIERHWPEAELTLWPTELGRGAQEFLQQAFPRLKIARGTVKDGKPTTPELEKAWEENDFLLHGSSAGFGARAHLAAWHRATGKPYGVFGTTLDPINSAGRNVEGSTLAVRRAQIAALPPTHLDEETRWIVDHAAFLFARETTTRDFLIAQGVRTPILEYGPDTQLAMHLTDHRRGDAYRAAHGLEDGKFICVIPRLRYTPYYRLNHTQPGKGDAVKDAINARTTEGDHAKLREVIVAYVRNTGNKVMACGEMTYQVQMAKEVLVDPLPDDVKKHVVWRDSYWMPDEAAAIYSRAQCVISVECHSPLISIHNGTPAFYVRQPTDTCKGQMYRDMGAGDWLFEIDETSGPQLWSRLESIHRDPGKARAKAKTIMAFVQARQQRMVEALREATTRV
ncbi:MAG: polysaccharide pyruvyl transferase family protein [Verrucomicrobia bacterium]|nr:polysaccharide pyruvyl transferase family protein [Verrucomicrobiota bacterium]